MQKFFGKKLLFVVAHPDDESFAAAGTIFQNHKLGGKNYIICATLGEKGKSHMPKAVSQTQLKKIRRRELERAAKFLKVDGLFFFNIPDTQVSKNLKTFSKKTQNLAKKIQPDYIFGFGPDGWSGHLDHIASGKAAKKLAKKLKIPFLAFSAPPEFIKRFQQIKNRRRNGKYAKTVKHAVPNIKVGVNSARKLESFKFHKSQFGASTMLADFPKSVKKGVMAYEYFIK
jgi:LmbE family N-acetylglucosaminyl deacetylase